MVEIALDITGQKDAKGLATGSVTRIGYEEKLQAVIAYSSNGCLMEHLIS